ncbi:hypothetical protein ACXZ1M_06105 [Duganella sp. PWIR1]
MFKITESRFALIISVVALAATISQAWSARKANLFNEEKVTIDAGPNENSLERTGMISCWGDGLTAITLNWQVTVFNNSTQPITIKNLKAVSMTPAGPNSAQTFMASGQEKQQFPILIEAKHFKTFRFPLLTRASPEFGDWFAKNEGCTGKPIWPSAEGLKRFEETGWPKRGSVRAVFTAVSGNGEKFFTEAVW